MHLIAMLLAILTSGWSIRLETWPSYVTRASVIQVTLAVTNHSGAGAYVTSNVTGPVLTVHADILDAELGTSLAYSGCSDDIYNVMNYNVYVDNGATANLRWPLYCFARIEHASTYDITVHDLSLSDSYQGSAVAVAQVRSNTLRLYLTR